MLLEYVDPGKQSVEVASAKLRGQTITEPLEEHDRTLHKMPKSYQRMIRLAREVAEADSDPGSFMNHGGFRPVYLGNEPSVTDNWAKTKSKSSLKQKTKQAPEA